MRTLNIYMTGVGGQGIGLLAETLAQACFRAGYETMGCDTLGVAQRGGMVTSHLRIGDRVFGPLIPKGEADVVVGLERLETLRAVRQMLRPGGAAIYCDTRIQPVDVRMGLRSYPESREIEATVTELGGSLERVIVDDLPDERYWNVALLGHLATTGLIPRIEPRLVLECLEDAVPAPSFSTNKSVFMKVAKPA